MVKKVLSGVCRASGYFKFFEGEWLLPSVY